MSSKSEKANPLITMIEHHMTETVKRSKGIIISSDSESNFPRCCIRFYSFLFSSQTPRKTLLAYFMSNFLTFHNLTNQSHKKQKTIKQTVCKSLEDLKALPRNQRN